ncbi:hypothetical protein Tco_0069938, partial [Tanacetum coccineum]
SDDEWLMTPVTPLMATVTFSSTYEVGGPSTTTSGTLLPVGQPFPCMTRGTSMVASVVDDLYVRMGNLEYGHGALVKKMGTVSDAQVADIIAVGEIWPRVTTVEGQMQVMASQAVYVVSRLEETDTQVQTLQTTVQRVELQNLQLQTRLTEMEIREGTLITYIRWMEECLAILEGRLPRSPPGPQ